MRKKLDQQFLEKVAGCDRIALTVTRIGLVVVTLWIGGLKLFRYEADGIVPFVANSPLMSFLLHDPSGYRSHINPEGKLIPANRAWHEANGTYPMALALGAVIVVLGLLIASHWIFPKVAVIGGLLLAGMSCVTLSFLITTPEVWVPALGDAQHGFPYLSGRGRLVIKDAIMMGAALVVAVDSARCALARKPAQAEAV